MSAVLEFAEKPPREVWLVSRYEPRKRKRVLLSQDEEEKILSSSEYEIVNGEIVERSMPNPEHARIEARITIELGKFLEENPLGELYTECHFQLSEALTRVPDVAFVSFERFPASGESRGSKWTIAPDLAIEIVSPTDDFNAVIEKIDEYLDAGVKQVWLVEPRRKAITIYRARTKMQILMGDDELTSEEVFPGLRLHVSEIFKSLKPR